MRIILDMCLTDCKYINSVEKMMTVKIYQALR